MATSAPFDEVIYAATAPGLEGPLADELASAGAAVVEVERGGVLARGPAGLHQEVCLRSRIANRVMLRLGEARGADAGALGQSLAAVAVGRLVDRGTAADISVSGRHPRVHHPERVARQAWGLSEPAGAVSEAIRLLLRFEGERCEVSVDCAGELLHRRGYRQETSRAPLRETLAAGILALAGFRGDEPLWDPMCGSGTFPIEAALIALRRAPGELREHAFMRWRSFDPLAWSYRLAAARKENRLSAPPILASDLNAGSLGVARRNARRAGVLPFLRLERRDARAIAPPDGVPSGLLVANLPYGKRVAEGAPLEPLFRDLGAALRRFRGWRVALLCGEGGPIEALGLGRHERVPLENGGLPCVLVLSAIR
jgi:putative N6-adenine-specific DNA methylase